MATILEKIKDQEALNEGLENFGTNLKKSPKDRLQKLGHVQGRVEALDALYKTFMENDRLIRRCCSAEEKTNPYFSNILLDKFNERFFDYKGTLNDLMRQLIPTPSPLTLTQREEEAPRLLLHQGTDIRHEIKLPHIMIPKFGGDYSSWLAFHDMFNSVVHSNTRLPPVQKMHYLKTCLVGEAEKLVRHLNVTEDNYTIAWDLLCTRYQNTRVLVNNTLKVLLTQPYVQTENPRALRQLLDRTKECLATLKTLKIKTDDWDPIINHLTVERLPRETRQLWEQMQGSSTSLPDYSKLQEFLETRFRTLEAIPPPSTPKTEPRLAPKGISLRPHTFHTALSLCPLCKGNNHSLRSCFKFKRLNVDERSKFVSSKPLCENCLAQSHIAKYCPIQSTCRICKQRHNTLLHPQDISQQDPPDRSKGKPIVSQDGSTFPIPTTSKLTSYLARENKKVFLATILLRALSSKGETRLLRALVDPGSEATFITNKAAQMLHLPIRRVSVEVLGIRNVLTATSESMVNLTIQPRSQNTPQLQIQAVALDSLTDLLPSRILPYSKWTHLAHLPLADPTYDRPGSIDMVLGAGFYAKIIQRGLEHSVSGAPTAQKTSFCWILIGEYTPDQSDSAPSTSPAGVMVSLCSQVKDECDMLRRFWEIEEVDMSKQVSAEDMLCEKLFAETHYRTQEGRYVVKLPFRPLPEAEDKFGSSREGAIKRFYSLRSRFNKNPQFCQEYQECLEEYIKEGHVQKITERFISKPTDRMFYLPHHTVQKADSLTTKTRVVFDASAKSSNGYSLNDRLLAGPALQRDIALLLFEWRQRKFVFTADIARMYRQILVDPGDSDYQRIIWNQSPNGSPEDYRLTTVTFGVSSAPFLAIRSLHQLARDEGQDFPIGANILMRDFYVDDLFSGGNTVSEAREALRQIDMLLKRGKFELRKWASNNDEVLSDISEHQRASPLSILLNKENVVKTLGLLWMPGDDCFKYSVQPISVTPPFTKRKILSTIARIYDPLGLLSLVTISSKILLQGLWQVGLTWDEPVPEEISAKWLQFIHLLSHLETVSIPRFLEVVPDSSIEIHGFCDASQRAYGAALYLRSTTKGSVKIHLVCAKTKVAPVKSISLPRLELCGAVLLSRLMKKFLPSVENKEKTTYAWTDSTVVLSWLRRHPNTLKTFVSNRVSEIITNLGPVPWNHVPSSDNPADYASRGISSSKLLQDKLWWHGPSWLSKADNYWPTNPHVGDPDPSLLELKPIKSFLSQEGVTESGQLLQRYSTMTRLLRVTALCKGFISRCRNKVSASQPSFITSSQLNEARSFWIKHEQRRFFSEDIDCLTKRKSLAKSSKLLNLNPFIDPSGLLRVGGRLANSDLPYNERHPAILHPDSHFTQLLIQNAHTLCLHGGLTLTLSLIRKTTWIINARKIVKKFIHKCITCFKNACKVQEQLMGSLPPARVKVSRPFTNVGVDYAGPFSLRISHARGCRTQKGYIAVFVCLCTKAIHIEVVSELTTKAFLAALNRFIARRGLCRDIYSDCGTTFKGAYNQLDSDIKRAVQQASQQAAITLSLQSIRWHFIPPASPHFGGLWEAGVKSIKYHLKRVAGNTPLTYEEMATLLTQVEACLNSRPLCPLTDNINDTRALTPGHFIIGDAPLAPPEEDFTQCKVNTLRMWNLVQRLKQEFWQGWSSEYLARLQQRPKWLKESNNLKVGDLVLIKSENLPSNRWALGRIIQLHPGDDQLTRVVTIKTQNGEYKRPITKVCLLPVDSAN